LAAGGRGRDRRAGSCLRGPKGFSAALRVPLPKPAGPGAQAESLLKTALPQASLLPAKYDIAVSTPVPAKTRRKIRIDDE
jgi:hypothetical protein